MNQIDWSTLPTEYLHIRDWANAQGLKYVNHGRHRVVFKADPGWVYKVAFMASGVLANKLETRKPEYPSARTEPVTEDYRVIRAEWVDREAGRAMYRHTRWPAWVAALEDRDDHGPQVGLTADGRLVAFDWEAVPPEWATWEHDEYVSLHGLSD